MVSPLPAAALAHPVVWLAAALVLLNDGVLRGYAPGWLTGKLSDLGWLVLAPVLLAPLLGWTRRPRAAALFLAGGFYVVLQLWPPLGRALKPDHVADAGDLWALPALLGAVWAWRDPRRRGAVPVVAGAALAFGTLAADQWYTPEDTSWPCAASADWDPAEPLRLQVSDWTPTTPVDTDAFARAISLRDDDGADVPLVVTALGGSLAALCARDGLRGDHAYTWTIGPWEGGANQVPFEHVALPTVHFRTAPGAGVPVATAADCAALAAELSLAVTNACLPSDRDSGDTSDPGESADTADTGDTG